MDNKAAELVTTLHKMESRIQFLKTNWVALVLHATVLSLVALFTTSLFLQRNTSLQDVNAWISLMLGFVATLLSIISMFLSFYNLEKESEQSRRSAALMMEIRESLGELKERVDEQRAAIEKLNSSQTFTVQAERKVVAASEWGGKIFVPKEL